MGFNPALRHIVDPYIRGSISSGKEQVERLSRIGSQVKGPTGYTCILILLSQGQEFIKGGRDLILSYFHAFHISFVSQTVYRTVNGKCDQLSIS